MTSDAEQKKSGRQARLTAAQHRDRDRQAFQLKIGGATFAQIAQALGYNDPAGALRGYRRHIAATTDLDTIEHYRELELHRLEDLRAALYNRAVGDPGDPRINRPPTPPDLEAIDRILRIHDRMVRLLGLNREPTMDPTEELLRFADERGLDRDVVLREADGIIASNQRRWQR